MSKKQINNRLNELFDNIKEEEKALEQPGAKSTSKKISQKDVKSASFDAKTEAVNVSVGTSGSFSTMSLPLLVCP